MPAYYGVPQELHGIESLKWLGELAPGQKEQQRRYACAEIKNLDRLMTMAYQDEHEDEYHTAGQVHATSDTDPRPYKCQADERASDNDSEQFEAVNLFEGEDIQDVLTVTANTGKYKYYAEPFEVILDSGAGDHVADDTDAPGYSVVESRGSKARQNFIAAGGHKIPNRGEMVLSLRSKGEGGGREITTTFQVAKVTRPLWSGARICDAGFHVTFTATGAKVTDKKGKVM